MRLGEGGRAPGYAYDVGTHLLFNLFVRFLMLHHYPLLDLMAQLVDLAIQHFQEAKVNKGVTKDKFGHQCIFSTREKSTFPAGIIVVVFV